MNEKTIDWMNNLDELRIDCARGQKKGLHFIAASVVVWMAVFFVHASNMPMLDKNIYTFWCTGITFPLALLFSKMFHIDFAGKDNPLNKVGMIFTCNQLIYLIIPLLLCNVLGEHMLMVFTIIFGAHLLPYSWLYKSRTYLIMAIIIPVAAVIIHIFCYNWVLAAVMIGIQAVSVAGLAIENIVLKK